MAVTVTLPTLSLGCSQALVLGKDTQLTCTIGAPSGVTVTATSGDGSLVAVSNDTKSPGGSTASAVTGAQGASITLQGLASYGTAEVAISAPGYQGGLFAIALRPAEFYLSSSFFSSPVSLRVGGSMTLTYAMRAGGGFLTPRAGAMIPVDIVPDPSGIVTLTPARMVFNGPQPSVDVQVKAVAPGSTLLRLAAPDGFLVPTAPFAISVTP
jgi:hypothetical protein